MLPIGSLLISPPLAGHAGTQSPKALLFPADVVHVTAMSLWLGGLATLAVAVPAAARRLEQPERGRLLGGTLSRFSGVALVAVAALAASGIVQAVVELGSVPALVETGYGRAVLAKVLLLGVLIGFGAANRRRLIPALTRAAAAASEPRADLGVAAAQRPRRGGADRRRPRRHRGAGRLCAAERHGQRRAPPPQGRVSGPDDDRRRDPEVHDRPRPGRDEPAQPLPAPGDGRPYTRASKSGPSCSLPDKGDDPADVRLQRVGPGHYVFTAAEFEVAGRWGLKVLTRARRAVPPTRQSCRWQSAEERAGTVLADRAREPDSGCRRLWAESEETACDGSQKKGLILRGPHIHRNRPEEERSLHMQPQQGYLR